MCLECHTLRALHPPSTDVTHVLNDEKDLYGKDYYLRHLPTDFGYADIGTRTRTDLPERCLHWLKTLLPYKLPPGRVLEIGCAHGGFVAMLGWAGFEAQGLELSPWLVGYAKQTFGVDVLHGPIEDQPIPPRSLDAVILMDVVEHLPDPRRTLTTAAQLLKEDGVLMIQTPHWMEHSTYAEMVSTNDPFLAQLKQNEHIYMFSQSSIQRLLHEIGFESVDFVPSVFSHYDMTLMAARRSFKRYSPSDVEKALHPRRLVQAMLDMDVANAALMDNLQKSEADRTARIKVIEEQGRHISEVDAQRNLLQAQLKDLQKHFQASEADRAARLKAIEEQGRQLGNITAERNNLLGQLAELTKQFEASEADRAARLKVIKDQGNKVSDLESQHGLLSARLADLQKHFQASEADRAARLKAIEEQGRQLGNITAERNNLLGQLASLTKQFEASEADRAARLTVIEKQGRHISEADAQRNLLQAQLKDLQKHFQASEADRADRLRAIENQGRQLGELTAERNNLLGQFADLTKQFEASEADRAARLKVIEDQGRQLGEITAERNALQNRLTAAESELRTALIQVGTLSTKAAVVDRSPPVRLLRFLRLLPKA